MFFFKLNQLMLVTKTIMIKMSAITFSNGKVTNNKEKETKYRKIMAFWGLTSLRPTP